MTDHPWRLLALAPLDPSTLELIFADLPVEVRLPAERTHAGVGAALPEAELVMGDWTGRLRLDADGAAAAGRLAFVQQPSVGVESIDLEALAAAGVPVANSAGANATAVAEWCVAATFGALRWLHFADAEVRAGRWPQLEIARRGGGELTGRRVGIVGMGPIGLETARRFTALGADVAYWSRRRRSPEQAGGARWLTLDDLLAHSDVLVVVIALGAETRGLLSADRLARLPPGAFVVNAARGGLIDESALLEAVRSGRLAGAALDVYAVEPLPADSPLRSEDRIVLSPHAAGATREAQTRLITQVVDNLRRAVTGEPVRHVVNGVHPVVRRRT